MKQPSSVQLDQLWALLLEWREYVEQNFSSTYRQHDLTVNEALVLVNTLVGPPNSQTRRAFLSQLDYADEVFAEMRK